MLLREVCEEASIFTFSREVAKVPPRRGFSLSDAISKSQDHRDTFLGKALEELKHEKFDRIIVITDEQTTDKVPDPVWEKAYVINVASYKNGIGYGKWIHIDGWSESVVHFIQEFESYEGK